MGSLKYEISQRCHELMLLPAPDKKHTSQKSWKMYKDNALKYGEWCKKLINAVISAIARSTSQITLIGWHNRARAPTRYILIWLECAGFLKCPLIKSASPNVLLQKIPVVEGQRMWIIEVTPPRRYLHGYMTLPALWVSDGLSMLTFVVAIWLMMSQVIYAFRSGGEKGVNINSNVFCPVMRCLFGPALMVARNVFSPLDNVYKS